MRMGDPGFPGAGNGDEHYFGGFFPGGGGWPGGGGGGGGIGGPGGPGGPGGGGGIGGPGGPQSCPACPTPPECPPSNVGWCTPPTKTPLPDPCNVGNGCAMNRYIPWTECTVAFL